MNFLKKMTVIALIALCTTANMYSQTENTLPKKEIIVASYGTSYNKTRTITIGGIENAFRESFPDYKIERVFTFQRFIDKLQKRDNLKVLNIDEALEKHFFTARIQCHLHF
ncbi:MAG: sirohydrochlorin cobaltochelatase [Treponema sp.]|nr:sirohydrochlorin cobaltochelatase [Treponema sp.]